MQRMMSLRRGLGVLAALVALAGAVPIYAQTGGMERRDERSDDRGAGRDAKQDCKAGDEKTPERNAGRRSATRSTAGTRAPASEARRGGPPGTASEAPAAQPAP